MLCCCGVCLFVTDVSFSLHSSLLWLVLFMEELLEMCMMDLSPLQMVVIFVSPQLLPKTKLGRHSYLGAHANGKLFHLSMKCRLTYIEGILLLAPVHSLGN
ncbi:hypothetical protein EDB19DRAFT_1236719 [Suillus lakei]|nr:hypothetical protein EDB19DRAFT_1236719 [Suillus lakei]